MKEIVSFFLCGKLYGVDVADVNGIELYTDVVKLGCESENIMGIADIREEKVPVLDIRKRLVMPQTPVTPDTRIIMLRTSHGPLSCVADGVPGIIQAEGNNVQEFPPLMHGKKTGYSDYVVKNENDLIIVLNPNKLLSQEEWQAVVKMMKELEKDSEGGQK